MKFEKWIFGDNACYVTKKYFLKFSKAIHKILKSLLWKFDSLQVQNKVSLVFKIFDMLNIKKSIF